MLCDLDHFKRINDTHGHLAGDAVLRAAALALRRCLRTADAFGRYGGEEFLAVLPESDLEAGRRAGERLRRALADQPIALPDGSSIVLTGSFGVAARAEVAGKGTASALVSLADRAPLRGQGGRPQPRLPMSDAAVELARLVEEVSGNVVPPAHLPFLEQAAAARVRATGHRDLAAYVASLRRGALAGEWSALLPLVTINESYLYRTPQHFAALERVLLPALMAARADRRRLRLWSAGCARGEEPATLAIVLAETPALAGWDWRILATDVDEVALAAARGGRFGERAVANVPPGHRERHFERQGGEYVLAPALRSRIEYRVLNLVHEPLVAAGGPFDVLFLRNVLIYFRPESQRRVAAAVAQHLAPDGRLFLGPAETLWQLTDALEPVDLGDCFCYRPREAGSGVGGQGSGKSKAEAGSGVGGRASRKGKERRGPRSGVRGRRGAGWWLSPGPPDP